MLATTDKDILLIDTLGECFATDISPNDYKTEKFVLFYHIQEQIKYIKEKINSGEIYYSIFHFHNDCFEYNDSRRYLPIDSNALIEKTVLPALIKYDILSLEESSSFFYAKRFFKEINEVYFQLLGRSDSFSEALYRNFNDQDLHVEVEVKFNKAVDLIDIIQFEKIHQNLCIIIEIGSLSSELLGLNDELPRIFFRVIYDHFVKNASDENSLKNAENELVDRHFFEIKEAYASSLVAKALLNESLKKTLLRIWNLFYIENGGANGDISDMPDNNILAKLHKVTGILQAYCLYAIFSGDNFLSYIPKKNDMGLRSGFALSLSTNTNKKTITMNCEDIIDSISRELNNKRTPLNYNGITADIDDVTRIMPNMPQHIKESSDNSLKISFSILSYLTVELLKETHEGRELSFKLVFGKDRFLREYFTPIFSLSPENHSSGMWTIKYLREDGTIKSKYDLKNQIDLLVSLVSSNYAFLQDKKVYLCFAVFNNEIIVRYIGKLNQYVTKFIDDDLDNMFTRNLKMNDVIDVIPNVIVSNIEKNNTFISYKKKLFTYNRLNRSWFFDEDNNNCFLYHNFKTCYKEHFLRLEKQLGKDLLKSLLEVLDIISHMSGMGTMVIISKNKRLLQPYITKSSELIEVLKSWKFDNSIDKYVLYNLAIKDGAICIYTDTKEVSARVFTAAHNVDQPFNPKAWKPESDKDETLYQRWSTPNDKYEWKEWGKWFKWGTRHISAAALAYLCKGEINIFTASSDDSIHFFDGYSVHQINKHLHEKNN